MENIKEIVENSNLFDSVYYVRTYRDVRTSNLTPLEHYSRHGIYEDRKPNAEFDPVWYREYYKDIKDSGMLPFVHYVVAGKEENRFQNEAEKEEYEALQKDGFDVEFYRMNRGKEILQNYKLLKNSEYMDSDFYLSTYIDIKENNIDPIEHYLLHGYKEYRNPSQFFDTKFYLEKYPDVRFLDMNPLLHYIQYGQYENREILPSIQKHTDVSVINSFFDSNAIKSNFISKKPIDIVIPVYNGKEYLEPLFKSIFQNTSMPYRLLVCDDKSSDSEVLPLLKKIRSKNKNGDFVLLENEQNLGFVGTVNKLSQLVENHFVLLNTDTEVPPYWIERLMYPIFSMEKIASTTPFTNAGTICSFPNYLEDNPIFEGMSVEELDSYFQKVNFETTYIQIPTGVGFCMGVNKELVDKIGMFDTLFGKGYGEENDWCQRAIENGYKNLHVTNLFVYHKHGGSFPSEEKKRLIAKNGALLKQKHETYDVQVQKTIAQNELKGLRDVLMYQIKSQKYYSTLIFDHALGGGQVTIQMML